MIGVENLYPGKTYSLMALTVNEKCLVKDFIEKLNEPDKKKILRLLTRTADNGLYTNEEKFRKIAGEDIWEFKSYQARIFCCFEKGKIIILSHGFIKKSAKTPVKQIVKAKKLFKEYQYWRERN